jgi:DNA-binding MarR family transcriptional regulator
MLACCHGTTLVQCTILTAIGMDGKVNLAELAERIGREKSWTSRAVDKLTGNGLLEKQVHPNDRRNILISLTVAGKNRLSELNTVLNDHAAQVLAQIPAKEQACVRIALELLQSAYINLKGTNSNKVTSSGVA